MSIKQKIASKICITKPDFKKEHVNLLKVLKTGKGLKAEYKDQAKELKAKIK